MTDDELTHMAELEAEQDAGRDYWHGVASEQLAIIQGLREQLAAAEKELAECTASHQRQNAVVAEFEACFCDKHLDDLPKACPVCFGIERNLASQRAYEEAGRYRAALEKIVRAVPTVGASRVLDETEWCAIKSAAEEAERVLAAGESGV